MLVTGGIITASPASAASLGPGHGDLNTTGTVGAFIAESDGRQVYCMDAGAPAPWNMTSGPTTVTDLVSYTGQQLSPVTLAKLNYVMAKWGDSTNPDITAAVQMYVWAEADPITYQAQGGQAWALARVPAAHHSAVLANLSTMYADANANHAVNPSVDVAISMADQYNGTLTVSVSPTALNGNVVLTDATFTDGTTSKALGTGTYPIVGKPAAGVPEYRVTASASYSGAGLGARVNLYETPGQQRLLANGTPAAVTATAQTPWIALDFQPVIGTQVATKYVAEGDSFTDLLTVSTVGVGSWIHVDGTPVPLTAQGTLYGPFDEQPTESETVPDGAPVVGSEALVLDRGTGEYASAGSLTASESGFYTWVWSIDNTAQGDSGKYIRGSFTDWFGRVAETHVTPFQPEAVSKTDARLALPGDEVTDTITVSSTNGAWLRIDGDYIPVVLDGTAYQVPGTLPPVEQAGVPSDATVIGEVQVTASGPGTYTSPPVAHLDAGFVTWVWEVRLESQSDEYRDYIANDWADNYGIPLESTSVRWPVSVTSEVREYNVHPNGRAFDMIEVTGFPDNHGDFTGDGYWGADLDVITHTVYGPFDTDKVLTDELVLDEAPVLTVLTTPARNGTYKLGYTDADQIRPTQPGYYVIVSDFAGDDRVQPFRSSPADILERFYVPQPPAPSVEVSVTTKATPEAFVGDPISDTAIVEGYVPDGAFLVFRTYGPFAEQPMMGEEGVPFFISEEIPVDGAGEYESGVTSVDTAGLVFWVETLHAADGAVLAEGFIGAPGETTIVHERPTEVIVTTKAVPEVMLGDPAHDVAIVTGQVPEGAMLAFQAYRQTSIEAVCDAENLVFDTHDRLIPVTRAGEYVSAEVVFEEVGTYFWIETLYDRDGEMLHRGECGAAGETTKVVEKSVTPSGPPSLAVTGAGWSWAGIIAALMLIATGGILWFGRRLALYRERTGYVRDEDLAAELEELTNE
ncbi:MAG: hypothetical protein KJ659_01755 [Actinobacteria bacterium]|nr:hypothetical protein [Actinomycetota bacterium]MBU1607738.1 hypothetical protein [Actinomycetota bacterium]MBU2314592.1 hypothetical protein [Actinomycetota bacterium]MBU2384213.1 hypothetical protein [Actinomycetota bacterium]